MSDKKLPQAPDSFLPMDWEGVSRLSANTRNSMAWDLLLADGAAQAAALAPLGICAVSVKNRESRSGLPRFEFDAILAGAILQELPDDLFFGALPWLERDWLARGEGWLLERDYGARFDGDLGALFCFFCLEACKALESGDFAAATGSSAKASALAATSLPMSKPWVIEGKGEFYRPGSEGRPRALFPEVMDAMRLSDADRRHGRLSLLACAGELAMRGDEAPLQAYLSSEAVGKELAALVRKDPSEAVDPNLRIESPPDWASSGLLSKLGELSMWAEQHLVFSRVLDVAVAGGGYPIREILVAMLAGARGDGRHPAVQKALSIYGDGMFELLAQRQSFKTAFAFCLEFAETNPSMTPMLGRLAASGIAAANKDNPLPRDLWGAIEDGFVSENPSISGAIEAALLAGRPLENPYKEHMDYQCAYNYANTIAPRLGIVGKSPSVDIAIKRLDALNIASIEAHPPELRRGLDSSPLMILARETKSAAVFGAILDWFGSKGLLETGAAMRAWVFESGRARKKGDLLAHCVALAKIDFASALMERLPALDVKSARDVAKAMAEHGGVGSAEVLSAWEAILFERDIAGAPALGEAAGEVVAPRRRALSL